jgi:ubiquitin-protein ligase
MVKVIILNKLLVKMTLREKRIKKDIKELHNQGYKVIIAHPNQIELYCPKIDRTIQINYSNDYPFKPPKVYINSISYLNFIKLNESFSRLYEKIFKQCPCICCISFFGKDWGPVLNSIHIVKQVEDFSSKKETMYLQVLNSIKQKFPWELITIFL